MILLPALQDEATTREAALHAARVFVRTAGITALDLTADVARAAEDGYVPGSFRRGEAVWRLVSRTQGLTLIVPYRAPFVARYDDARSFFRPARPGWSRKIPAARARVLAHTVLVGLGVPGAWPSGGDTFTSSPNPKRAVWPLIALMGRVERPDGIPVIGAGNAASLQLEPNTGALRWFAQRRDLRFLPPRKRLAPKRVLRANGGRGEARLVWDARDPDRRPRLVYRVDEAGHAPRYVDAETG